jgi:hypothetical protein
MSDSKIIVSGDNVKGNHIMVAEPLKVPLQKLSEKQIALMQQVRQNWLDYIFSCKNSIDKEKANLSIEWLYKFAGIDRPIIIYVDSPIGCQYAVQYLKVLLPIIQKNSKKSPKLGGAQVRAQVWDQVGAQVWDQVGAQVWDQVGDQVRAQVWDQVRDQVRAQVGAQVWDQVGAQVRAQVRAQVWDQVWDQVRAQVGAQVWDQVGAQVRDQVRAQVWDQVWDQVRAQVWDQVWDQVRAQVGDQVGAQVWDQVGDQKLEFNDFSSYGNVADYNWVSFFDFFTQIGIIDHGNFNNFKELLLSGIYDMIQLNGFCIVSNLPSKISRNNNNRLHGDSGPAIEFRDGYKLYFWNGVAVPGEWIDSPGTITKETIIKEKNAEKRRCLREIIGTEKYAQLLDIVEIDRDHVNQQDVILYKTRKKDDIINDFIYFVNVTCHSTKRKYFLCIPKEAAQNAWGAVAWTFNMNKEQYMPLIET